MTRLSIACCALWTLAGGCTFSPSLGQGDIVCSDEGTCPPKYYCWPDNKCYTQPYQPPPPDLAVVCVPIKCPTGACGMLGDGCGHVLDCGSNCPPSQPVCGGGGPNMCGTKSCTPLSSCGPGQGCGTIPDGCAATVACGTCAPGQVCSGDGTPNHCCVPLTACPAVLDCGTFPDGCGGAVTCGTLAGACQKQQVCGGGGKANKCAAKGTTCTPITKCSDVGKNCGSISNGCDGIIPSCGTCALGKTCVNNVCQ